MSYRNDHSEKSATIYVEKARESQFLGRYKSSFDLARKSLNYRTYGEAYFIMGRCCQKLGKFNQAIEYLKQGAKLYELDFSKGIGHFKWIQDYIEACLIISGILYDKGKFKESFKFTDKATLLSMSQEEKISQRIQKKIDQAEKRQLLHQQEKPENQKFGSEIKPQKYKNNEPLIGMEQNKLQVDDIRNLKPQIQPEVVVAQQNLQGERYDEARKTLSKYANRLNQAEAFFILGKCSLISGNFEEALENFNFAVEFYEKVREENKSFVNNLLQSCISCAQIQINFMKNKEIEAFVYLSKAEELVGNIVEKKILKQNLKRRLREIQFKKEEVYQNRAREIQKAENTIGPNQDAFNDIDLAIAKKLKN